MIDIAPGFSQLFHWLSNLWMPWLGKTFHSPRKLGDNIFSKDSYLVARLFNLLYRGFVQDSESSYRAFAVHTYIGPGLADPDRLVLKIDYNLAENPSLIVRRVLDELLQLGEDVYLGKLTYTGGGAVQATGRRSLTLRSQGEFLVSPGCEAPIPFDR